MKRTLALTLALVLCLGLCAPALAAETDGTYYVDGQSVDTYPVEETPPMDEDTVCLDFYEEYAQEHPEEIANLDTDALIAGWGYTDINMTAEEAFMERFSWANVTLEDAVKIQYINNRVRIEELRKDAADYKEQYPEAWAAFDADAFFEEGSSSDAYYAYWAGMTKAEYMAEWNILTDEEFADDMFVQGAWADEYEKWDDDGWYDPDGEPTLTLMVNGVASEIAIEAGEGTTYADAAALRSILGDQAVAADATGSIAIRPAAEAAGWDVQWYDDGWGVQEVQLWNKTAFEAELAEEFGPFDDFLARFLNWGKIKERLYAKEPVSARETLDVVVTKFSTLNGDTDCKLTLEGNTVYQNGVVDMTLTFDAAQYLDLMPEFTRAMIEQDESAPSWERLTQALKAGKMEFIADYNTGEMAYRIPLLGLVDPSMGEWQSTGFDPDVEEGPSLSLTAGLYDDMLEEAARSYYDGAQEALADYQEQVGTLRAFVGKDCFTTRNGKTTWAVTTQKVNQALGQALGLAQPDKASLFKTFELNCALDGEGRAELSLHIRPDVAGIQLAALETDNYYSISYTVMNPVDMDLTASFSGRLTQGTGRMNVHVDNSGKMHLRYQSYPGSGKAPRQVKDVLPLTVEPTPGTILTNAS